MCSSNAEITDSLTKMLCVEHSYFGFEIGSRIIIFQHSRITIIFGKNASERLSLLMSEAQKNYTSLYKPFIVLSYENYLGAA